MFFPLTSRILLIVLFFAALVFPAKAAVLEQFNTIGTFGIETYYTGAVSGFGTNPESSGFYYASSTDIVGITQIELVMYQQGAPTDDIYAEVWETSNGTALSSLVATSETLIGGSIQDPFSLPSCPTLNSSLNNTPLAAECFTAHFSFNTEFTLYSSSEYIIRLKRTGSLDNTNHYRQLARNQNISGWWGLQCDLVAFPGGSCVVPAGNESMWFRFTDDYVPPVTCNNGDVTQTCFSNIQPEDGETTASTTVTFSADLFRGTELAGYYPVAYLELYRLDFAGSIQPIQFKFNAAFSGTGSFATTTVLNKGIYAAIWSLGYDDGSFMRAATQQVEFTVVQSAVGALNDILDNFGGSTSTPPDLESCVGSYMAESAVASSTATIFGFSVRNFVQSFTDVGFSYFKCLFYPQPGVLGLVTTDFRNNFLVKAPWGYGLRMYDILNGTTSTSTLPSIAFTMPANMPGGGKTFDYSPWAPIESFVTRLENSTTSTMEGSAMDNFLFYWNLMWYLVFGFWLLRLIFNAWNVELHDDDHMADEIIKDGFDGKVRWRK